MNIQEIQQKRMRDFANAAARVLIASFFIVVAMGLIIDPDGIIKHQAFIDMPGYLRWPSAAFEMVAALSILIGFQTRTAVLLLAVYVFWSSFIFNYIPSNELAIGSFWRDLTIIGALLLLFAHGTGYFSLDGYLTRKKSRKEAPVADLVNMADIAQDHASAASST